MRGLHRTPQRRPPAPMSASSHVAMRSAIAGRTSQRIGLGRAWPGCGELFAMFMKSAPQVLAALRRKRVLLDQHIRRQAQAFGQVANHRKR
jgi:hypothetical protein